MTTKSVKGHPITAGLRSAVIPGWGQLATGRRALGWMLILLTTVTAALLFGSVLALGPLDALSRLADSNVLGILLIVNAAVAVIRIASTVHAWWSGGGRHLLGAVALALLVAAPHIALGWVGHDIRNTLVTVFAPEPPPATPTPVDSVTLPTTTVTFPTTTVTTPTTTVTLPTNTVTLPTTTGIPPATTGIPPTTTAGSSGSSPGTSGLSDMGRVNLLLLGGDAGPGRWGLRTDTVMVASVDTVSGEAALFGLPRNFGSLRFTDGTDFPGLILNEVYAWGHDHPEAFGGPNPGAAAIADVATALTGLEIDYFMLVDLTGFADVVDAFGGVEMVVPSPIDGPLYDAATGGYEMIHIPAGSQRLDGATALAYARSRHTTSDYDRMGRQRCILTALVGQADPVSLLTGLPDLLAAVERNISTDIPLALVPDLVRLAGSVRASEIRVLGFGPEWGKGRNSAGYTIPDVDRIQRAVQDAIENPASTVQAATAGDACR